MSTGVRSGPRTFSSSPAPRVRVISTYHAHDGGQLLLIGSRVRGQQLMLPHHPHAILCVHAGRVLGRVSHATCLLVIVTTLVSVLGPRRGVLPCFAL